MLRELKIVNLALIDELHILFSEGLVVLTGETGAGKSIILQAIHLLSGGRGAADWIRTGKNSASVEALFECNGSPEILRYLEQMDVDHDGTLVVKRVLLDSGKSRYYINGTLATAKLIAQVIENLLSVASQHDHQQLLHSAHHLDFVDSIGNLWKQRQAVARLYDIWQSKRSELHQLQEKEKEKEQRRDFLMYQCKEIEDAEIEPGEDEQLKQEKDRLRASDELMRLGQASYELLHGSVYEALAEVRKNLEQMEGHDGSLADLTGEFSEQFFLLEDKASQLRQYIDNIPSDPALLDAVTERIHLLQQLKRKYGPSLDEVLRYAAQAAEELRQIEDMDELLKRNVRELAAIEKELIDGAGELSVARRKVSTELAARISRELDSLSFNSAVFEIRFNSQKAADLTNISRTGCDNVEFVFSANPGEPLKPVAKIASGGELSRLMLALKCILAQKDRVKTVIFDEVDAGISGKAAEAVARKIQELASHHQVLCITHLPHIAARAGEHFKVAKVVNDNRTLTTIENLPPEARINEIARMLDGESITANTLSYARELIGRYG